MKRNNLFDTVNVAVTGLFSLFCALPMLLVIMVSVTDETMIKKYGYSFFPREFSLDAYKLIFDGNDLIQRSYMISILITVIGTTAAVLFTAAGAYALANRQVKCRNGLSLFFFITMVFNPGLVPWYIMCTKLGLKDNILALIIPTLIFNPFNLFLVRNFMRGIPDSLMESAKIDGANDMITAFKIYFPLSKPVLATIALFYGIGYWNDWFNSIMLLDNPELYPLQFMLYKIKSEIEMLNKLQGVGALFDVPTDSFKMATAVITIGPIILLYPYLQKYFIKGMVIGSVKG